MPTLDEVGVGRRHERLDVETGGGEHGEPVLAELVELVAAVAGSAHRLADLGVEVLTVAGRALTNTTSPSGTVGPVFASSSARAAVARSRAAWACSTARVSASTSGGAAHLSQFGLGQRHRLLSCRRCLDRLAIGGLRGEYCGLEVGDRLGPIRRCRRDDWRAGR